MTHASAACAAGRQVRPIERGESREMTIHRYAFSVALACLLAGGARRAEAQQPVQRQVDSLAAELRALRARLDSLRAALGRQPGAAPARAVKDTGAVDELAALRAAAAAAAGTDTLRGRADTSGQTRFVGRERNQAQLNPEISVTGDVRASAERPGVQRDNFDPRSEERRVGKECRSRWSP